MTRPLVNASGPRGPIVPPVRATAELSAVDARLDALEADNATLKTQVADLETRVADLEAAATAP